MKLEVNIDKKYFFALVLIGLIVIGIVGVVAYNSAGVPATFGHSVNEIEWSQAITKNVTAAGFCIGSSTNCKTDWGSVAGITQINAGNGIIVTSEGAGIVRINATGGGGGAGGSSQWQGLSGNPIYYTGGYVGIGTTNPSAKLDVLGDVKTSGVYRKDGASGISGTFYVEGLEECRRFKVVVSGGIITSWNCPADYAINSLKRCYSDRGCGADTTDWYSLITDNLVLQSITKTDVSYTTSQGVWLPISTRTISLKENVAGEHTERAIDPRSGYYVKYRVYADTKVGILSKTWANHGEVKLNRQDRFERKNQSVILINGLPQEINVGGSYEIQRFAWNPGDNGAGLSYLKINNTDPGFFDVEVYVWERDEQYDSAHAKIDSFIESI